MKKIVFVSTLLLSLGTAHAVESPRWDMASISYQSSDVDGEKLTGLSVLISKSLGENFFVVSRYGSFSGDMEVSNVSVDLYFTNLSVGLGSRYSIAKNTDFFGVLSYENVEIENSAPEYYLSDSNSGYGLQIGVRSMISEKVELNGSINYVDIEDESETGFGVSALYNFTGQFSAGVGYSQSGDVDSMSVSAVCFF